MNLDMFIGGRYVNGRYLLIRVKGKNSWEVLF